MKKFHKFFITLILLGLGCVVNLYAAESVVNVFLSPNENATPIATVRNSYESLSDERAVMDEALSLNDWRVATWNGTLRGYVIEGSSNKQLTLPAGAMVYQSPSLESEVITMVDANDERDENFHVVDVQNNWEVVEFQKPIRVYLKTAPESAQITHPAQVSQASQISQASQNTVQPDVATVVSSPATTHTTHATQTAHTAPTAHTSHASSVPSNGSEIIDLESGNNWVVASSDGSTHSWRNQPVPSSEDVTTAAEVVTVNESDPKWTGTSSNVTMHANELVLENEAENRVIAITTQADSSEVCEPEVCEKPVMRKRVLPPIDQDPLVRRCAAPVASANRSLSGKLIKSSLLCCMMECGSHYELVDNRCRTLAYLDLSDVNDICHYLNKCVVVQGPVCCKRPSAPLTMKVKLIRIVR